MDLKTYQDHALKTAVYPRIGFNWQYPLIGLGGELGELMNILKKTIRDDHNKITEIKKEKLKDELGDIFWYLVVLCWELKIDPDLVLELNIDKLEARKNNNTLHDTGDRKI